MQLCILLGSPEMFVFHLAFLLSEPSAGVGTRPQQLPNISPVLEFVLHGSTLDSSDGHNNNYV